MKANNLTISIPANCNKDCPYCISKMTFAPEKDINMFRRNISKAYNVAETSGVDTVLISSKGEPLNAYELTRWVIRESCNRFVVELQTNGAALVTSLDKLNHLYNDGLNVLALSIDKPNDFKKLKPLFIEAERIKMVVRITVVLTDRFDGYGLGWFLDECVNNSIKQLTFRKVTAPEVVIATGESHKVREWIKNNNQTRVGDFMMDNISKNIPKDKFVRKLPFGMSVYDLQGIGVTVINYCIQESSNGDDLRSLIYHQDGHMYTSWDKPGSILF